MFGVFRLLLRRPSKTVIKERVRDVVRASRSRGCFTCNARRERLIYYLCEIDLQVVAKMNSGTEPSRVPDNALMAPDSWKTGRMNLFGPALLVEGREAGSGSTPSITVTDGCP